MIKKVLMAATIVVLVLLIIITPRLIGTGEEVQSIPRLLVDYVGNETKIFVVGTFGDYRYSNISIYAENTTIGWNNFTTENDTYTLRRQASISTSPHTPRNWDMNSTPLS
jgi:hypothetical protein